MRQIVFLLAGICLSQSGCVTEPQTKPTEEPALTSKPSPEDPALSAKRVSEDAQPVESTVEPCQPGAATARGTAQSPQLEVGVRRNLGDKGAKRGKYKPYTKYGCAPDEK